jgi:hypothetical protein
MHHEKQKTQTKYEKCHKKTKWEIDSIHIAVCPFLFILVYFEFGFINNRNCKTISFDHLQICSNFFLPLIIWNFWNGSMVACGGWDHRIFSPKEMAKNVIRNPMTVTQPNTHLSRSSQHPSLVVSPVHLSSCKLSHTSLDHLNFPMPLLRHLAPYSPLLITLIMHAPLSVMQTFPCLSSDIWPHIHLSQLHWSCMHLSLQSGLSHISLLVVTYTSLCRTEPRTSHLYRSSGPMYTSLGQPAPWIPLSVIHPYIHI